MEVLRKVPVIQHFWFGGILSWRNQSNEAQMSSSGDGKELIEVEDQKIVEENNNLQSTKVPWSVLPNSATTSRSGPTLQNRTQAPWSAIGVPRSFTPPEPFSRNGRN